jgi:hypothetical protein
MEIIKRGNLVEGGFADLKEHRLMKDSGLFGSQENNNGSWPDLENFVYLADARVAGLFRHPLKRLPCFIQRREICRFRHEQR